MTKRNTITSFGHNLSAAAPSELPELAIFCETGKTDRSPTPAEEAVAGLIQDGAQVRWVGKDEMVIRMAIVGGSPLLAVLLGDKMATFPLQAHDVLGIAMIGARAVRKYTEAMGFRAHLDGVDAIVEREAKELKKGDSEGFDGFMETLEYARNIKFTPMDDDEVAEAFWTMECLAITVNGMDFEALTQAIRGDVARLKEAGSIAADAISQAKH